MPNLKDEKENIQRFISGFPLSFKDQIEFDETFIGGSIQKVEALL